MKLKVFSIYDNASELFSEPFVAVNDEVAKRKFSIICSGSPDMMTKDLQLVFVAFFDNCSGEFEQFTKSVPILTGEDFLAMRGEQNGKK